MRMRNSIVIVASFLIVLMSVSCKKECDTDFRDPIISFDEPVVEGEELVLVARGEADDTYSWTGPNDFKAGGKIVSLGPANRGMNGLYSVTVSRKGCGEKSSSNNLEISTLEAPCQPPIIEIEIDKYPNIQAVNTICGYDTIREAYTVNYSSLYGSFYVVFPNSEPPEYDQTYLAAGESDSLRANEVRVEVYTGEQPNLQRYLGLNGNVYCKVGANFLEIIVCDLSCTRSDGLVYVTGKIECGI